MEPNESKLMTRIFISVKNSLWSVFLWLAKYGCIVLKVELNSTDKIQTWCLGFSRCLTIRWMILVTASSVLFHCLKASTVCESTDTWMTGNQSGVMQRLVMRKIFAMVIKKVLDLNSHKRLLNKLCFAARGGHPLLASRQNVGFQFSSDRYYEAGSSYPANLRVTLWNLTVEINRY